ncbi:AlbA family DNA-binding domain-containing protein [Modestobacter lapidis]|nr:ATP-binding protein [Modestobacter lapidis]
MAALSLYLGPRKARLKVETWGDLVLAANAGVLDETHWVELKEAVPASNKPANLELAKDLASLSVEGGVFIVGIEDDKGGAGAVVGTDLTGLETRIDQVTGGRISPPLSVTLDVILKPDTPGVGVLVVTVPASEVAPHMVDGQYWGRGAQRKRVLSDDEVRRLLADRQARSAGFAERLRDAPVLDPSGLDELGRLYLRIEPAAAASEPVSDLLAGKHVLEVVTAAVQFRTQWSPSFGSLTYNVPHPDGLAAASLIASETGEVGDAYLFLLLGDDGTVQLSSPAVQRYGRAADAPLAVTPGLVLEMLHGGLEIAGHVATQTGYQGAWRVGLFVTKLRGVRASQAYYETSFQRFLPYPSDEYVAEIQTTTRELAEETPAAVERLAKGLLRGLGVDRRFLPYEEPGEFALRSH